MKKASEAERTALSDALPHLMTVGDVAELLSVSIRTVWRLDSAGKLPSPLRIGRSVKWRRHEIIDWLERDCPPRE